MSNQDTNAQGTNTPPAPRRPLLRRGLTAAAFFAGGIVVGAGGLAVAGGGMGPMGPMGPMGWHHGHHRGVGMLQHGVRNALDDVGATTAQEDKVHDIIAAASTELSKEAKDAGTKDAGVKEAGGMEGTRRQILDLMKAPTLDRDAFEKLRTQKVAEMEAKSKVVTNALFDAASQLTPEQRVKLADRFEARMEHGWFGHRRERGERGPEGRDGRDGRDGGSDHPDRPDRG